MSIQSEIDTAIKNKVNAVVKGVTDRVVALALREAVNNTPVDTGRARGNWQVSASLNRVGTVETQDKGGGTTIAAGLSVSSPLPPFSKLSIANNLPYIQRLEDGYSKKGGHMVALAIAKVDSSKLAIVRAAARAANAT